ncbi:hypothetical protein B0H13DRAFT_1133105 [Mycena leptocephala]|nr:hypothetical protein B0H13DRAFT_1133105 [Mycena leptocephala]
MAIDAEEFWNSPLVGSFKVRRIGLRPQKPQQRVTIDPFHGPLTPKPPHHGPYTNIHKHSRVMAFSIHRHYKPARADPDVLGSRQRATGGVERPTAMLLLAPRHVQEVHMSKTTTKRLASHGLLDEAEPGEEPKRLGKEKEKESVATSSRDYGAPSSDTRDQGFRQSSPRARSTFASHKSRSVEGEGDSDSDTDTERSERASSHTTHSEAFSTMDASSIEQMQMVFAQESEGSNGMLSRVLRRGPPVPRPSRAATPQVYIPPWMKLKQEEHTRRLNVLNSSIHDVGLLPPKKSMGRIGARRRQSRVLIFSRKCRRTRCSCCCRYGLARRTHSRSVTRRSLHTRSRRSKGSTCSCRTSPWTRTSRQRSTMGATAVGAARGGGFTEARRTARAERATSCLRRTTSARGSSRTRTCRARVCACRTRGSRCSVPGTRRGSPCRRLQRATTGCL